MKKFIIILCLGFALVGCKKTVRITDTDTNTSIIISEDGAIIEGTIPIGNGVEITVTEEE